MGFKITSSTSNAVHPLLHQATGGEKSMQEADKNPQKEDWAMPNRGTPLIRNLLSNLILQADIKHSLLEDIVYACTAWPLANK